MWQVLSHSHSFLLLKFIYLYAGTFECQDGVTNNCTQVCTRNISSDEISAYECSCNAGYILNENDTSFCDGELYKPLLIANPLLILVS